MTSPFTTVRDRNPDDENKIYLPWGRTKNKLLIVRPLEYQKEGFVTANAPKGTDVVFADVALLDGIAAAVTEDDEELPAFDAGTQFRSQIVFAAYLKGTFKRYIGATLIGTTYRGPITKGKPPIMWTDLSGDPACVARGQKFLIAHPEFLVPLEAQFTQATPEIIDQSPGYSGGTRATRESVYNGHDPGTKGPAQATLDQMRAMAKANGGDQDPPF